MMEYHPKETTSVSYNKDMQIIPSGRANDEEARIAHSS